MDLRTGKTYDSFDAAVAAGVPEADIALIERLREGIPVVKFSKGSFKSYLRDPESGDLVQVPAAK